MTQRPDSPEVALPDPPTHQVPPMSSEVQTPDRYPSPARLTRAQKFKAKRAAKKRSQEEQGPYLAHAEVAAEVS